jgi:hypothetical protein
VSELPLCYQNEQERKANIKKQSSKAHCVGKKSDQTSWWEKLLELLIKILTTTIYFARKSLHDYLFAIFTVPHRVCFLKETTLTDGNRKVVLYFPIQQEIFHSLTYISLFRNSFCSLWRLRQKSTKNYLYRSAIGLRKYCGGITAPKQLCFANQLRSSIKEAKKIWE